MASYSGKKKSKSQKRKDTFMELRNQPEGGLVEMPNRRPVYICRACHMTMNNAIKSEQEWFGHLQSSPHQQRHIGFDFRKYLWDVDRILMINECLGIHQNDIIEYISQAGCNIVDFCYTTQKPGGLNNCHVLVASLEEAKQITTVAAHYIGKEKRKFLIQLLQEKGKENWLQARERFLQTCLGNNSGNSNKKPILESDCSGSDNKKHTLESDCSGSDNKKHTWESDCSANKKQKLELDFTSDDF